MRLLLLLAAALLAGTTTPMSDGGSMRGKPFGVLLLGEGGEKGWDELVAAVAKRLGPKIPLEFAPGLADQKTIQKAADKLGSQSVKKIVVVPVYLSSNSELMDQTRFLFGIRQDPSLDFFGSRRGGSILVRRVMTKADVVLTQALDDNPAVVDILASRAASLSRAPAKEGLILVSVAPASDEGAQQWSQTLTALAERARAKAGMARSASALLPERGLAAEKEKAEKAFKTKTQEFSRQGGAIVVPVTLTASALERRVPRVLSGSFMRFNGKALLPDERLAAWVEQTAVEGARLPGMRQFKDAGRPMPKPKAAPGRLGGTR